MKLRNKKTGKIVKVNSFNGLVDLDDEVKIYASLAELNEEWEDAPEEPEERWAIDQFGEPINVTWLSRLQLEKLRRYGNDFPSEDATIEAIEKLKALQRLKDKEFKFNDWEVKDGCKIFFELDDKSFNAGWLDENIVKDLDLLFGGKE